jgi:hypothetical protein
MKEGTRRTRVEVGGREFRVGFCELERSAKLPYVGIAGRHANSFDATAAVMQIPRDGRQQRVSLTAERIAFDDFVVNVSSPVYRRSIRVRRGPCP